MIAPGECLVDVLQMLPCSWQNVSPRVFFWVRVLDLLLFEIAFLFIVFLAATYYGLSFAAKFPWEWKWWKQEK